MVDHILSGADEPNNVLIGCQMLDTIKYEKNYEAYEVVLKQNSLMFNLTTLGLIKIYSMHKIGERNFIASKENLRQQLFGNDFKLC